ncbi:MAG: sortase [Oscillospiraceae bacterium]|nr:sortase [Oscillospiraceae bacterium]
MNKKYGKFLTILLIVIAILVIGLLIFFAVDTINKWNINNSADDGIGAFKNVYVNTDSNTSANSNNNLVAIGDNTSGGTINPYANIVFDDENSAGDGTDSNTGNIINTSNGNTDGINYKGFTMVGYIEIPKTNIKYPVLSEASVKGLETAVAILTGPGLNKTGNTVIVGHDYRNGTFFSDNAKLSIGDKIYITDTSGKTVTYTIYKKYQAAPEDASFIRDTQGATEITLSTCTDDAKNRIIIWAKAD